MLVGIDINEAVDYTSPLDKSEPKTVFKLGVIPTVVMASLKDQSRVVLVDLLTMDGKTPVRTNVGEMQLNYVRYGLRGWANFKDRKGSVLQFKTQKIQLAGKDFDIVSDETLNFLSDDIVQELADKIRDLNTLSSAEIKNSA